jgi:hypothetical protein
MASTDNQLDWFTSIINVHWRTPTPPVNPPFVGTLYVLWWYNPYYTTSPTNPFGLPPPYIAVNQNLIPVYNPVDQGPPVSIGGNLYVQGELLAVWNPDLPVSTSQPDATVAALISVGGRGINGGNGGLSDAAMVLSILQNTYGQFPVVYDPFAPKGPISTPVVGAYSYTGPYPPQLPVP